MTPSKTYLVGRLVDEHSPHRADLFEIVRAAFPDDEILDGVELFASNDDWLDRWREILRSIDRVIVLPGPHGEVGLGGLQEMVDAFLADIPVQTVTATGVRPIERLSLGTDVLDLENVAVTA